MKRCMSSFIVISSLAFVLCAGAFAAPQADAENLLTNSDFADGLKGWYARDRNGASSISIDKEEKYNGKNSVRIELKNPEAKVYGDVSNTPPAKLSPSVLYRISYQLKGKGAQYNGISAMTYYVKDIDAKHSWSHTEWTLPWKETDFDWNQVSGYFISPPGNGEASVYIGGCKGTVWAADVRLAPIGKVLREVKWVADRGPIKDNNYVDAEDGTFLSDGIVDSGWDELKGKRIACIGAYPGLDKSINFTAAVPQTAAIDRVIALVERGRNSSLKSMEVSCEKYGETIKVGETTGWAAEDTSAKRLYALEVPVGKTASRLNVKFTGSGSLFISEIVVLIK